MVINVFVFVLANRLLWFWATYVERRLREYVKEQVRDPRVAEKLTPTYGFGCKRPTLSYSYLSTFNRANTELVTASIDRVCKDGIVTDDGRLHELDAIVWATGFLTTEKGNVPGFEVYGKGGQELGQFWDQHRFQSYKGIAVAGFPNLFLTCGPYTGGFNWYNMLEAHAALMMKCLDEARAKGASRIEVDQTAQDLWMKYIRRCADSSLLKAPRCSGSNSYYVDRHGDSSLYYPQTPFWRSFLQNWWFRSGFSFSGTV